MSILKEKDGRYSLTCDRCGDGVSAESWDEAKAIKALYGWRSVKMNGHWQDVCDRCLEQEEITWLAKKQNADLQLSFSLSS